MTQPAKPKRGRPTDPALQEKRREDLLDAAFELLRHKSYRSITIRELASQANTQSAMIKYYFNDKQECFWRCWNGSVNSSRKTLRLLRRRMNR
ncbi:helix-turn-helix domain-containing protein [Aliamphritea spongicola]|nr:helix-turn-helix domain-containing protein [Aliamphritea spongicola]